MTNWVVYQTVYLGVNSVVYRASETVYVAMYRASETVYWAVGLAVRDAVYEAMGQAVNRAVDVAHAQSEEPLHPGLAIYLGGVP